MVGVQQQLRGIAKRRVGCPPFRIRVTVRADDRQLCHFTIEPPCDRTSFRLCREQPVGMQGKALDHWALA